MTWAKLSSTLEPYNYHRKIIGFDTFSGIPKLNKLDRNKNKKSNATFKEKIDILNDIKNSIKDYDLNRFIKNKAKIELIKGDARKTIPNTSNQISIY